MIDQRYLENGLGWGRKGHAFAEVELESLERGVQDSRTRLSHTVTHCYKKAGGRDKNVGPGHGRVHPTKSCAKNIALLATLPARPGT